MGTFSDDRIREIVLGTRAFRTYPFPGTTEEDETTVAVRVLTETEMDGCRVAAQGQLRERASSRGWKPEGFVLVDPDVLDRFIERQVIFRAFFDPDSTGNDNPTRFFESPKAVGELSAITATQLVGLYMEHQEWVSPLNHLEEKEVGELVEALGKEQAPGVSLRQFEPNTLRRCVISMASSLRSATSQTSKSISGSSAEAKSENESGNP